MVKEVWYDATVRTALDVASSAVKATNALENNIRDEDIKV
jgi:hypothetical protein